MINILAKADSFEGGVGYFRIHNPLNYIAEKWTTEFRVTFINNINWFIMVDGKPQFNRDLFKQFDIIHCHKWLDRPETNALIAGELKKLGVKIIIDVDDWWDLPTHHPLFKIFNEQKIAKHQIEMLKLADWVTTTTNYFAEQIKPYNKKVRVIPNMIDPNEAQWKPNPSKSNLIRVGWLGSSSHEKDLEQLNGVPNQLSDLSGKMGWVLCGFDTRSSIDVGGRQQMVRVPAEGTCWARYEQFFTNNYKWIKDVDYRNWLLRYEVHKDPLEPENREYRRIWTRPVKEFGIGYNDFDIALAPLYDTQFNRCKSPLKIVEAGFHKKPLIATDCITYRADWEESKGLVLIEPKRTHKDWAKEIRKMVESETMRVDYSERLYEWVNKKYNLSTQVVDRVQFYRDLAWNLI